MGTNRAPDRLMFFSDAVIAIAMTLLVLPLVDLAPDVAHGEGVGQLLSDNRSRLLAFVLSFVVISTFWAWHHQLFENIIGYSGPIVWLNLFWLISIVFLPFPTEVLAVAPSLASGAPILYIATLGTTSLAALAQQLAIARRPDLQSPDARGSLSVVPSVITAVITTTSLVISLFIPELGLYALLLLVFGGPTETLVKRLRVRLDATGDAQIED